MTAGFYDVAVRYVVMSLAAFTLARLTEVREGIPAHVGNPVGSRRTVTA